MYNIFQNDLLPKPPAYIFMIDVSYNNMKSGMVHVLCANMKEILKLLPKEEGDSKTRMRVGFVTYNSTVHFYNVKVSCSVIVHYGIWKHLASFM